MSRVWSGQVARSAREAAGFERPDDVAEAIGVHRASVYAWEGGREPQLRWAAALADLYRVTLDSFFTHAPEPDRGSDGRGKSHEPDTAAVGGSAGLAHHGG